MRRSVLATVGLGVVGGLAFWACGDEAPLSTQPDAPGISTNTTGTSLVTGFTFLPPLVKQVTTSGEFNPNLLPAVEICQHGGGAPSTPDAAQCLHPVTGATGPLVLPADLAGDHYQAQWDTDKDKTGTFRVFATLPGGVLGYVDVQLEPGGGAKKANGEVVDAVVENAGRTIPVQFHISNEGRIGGFDPDITDQDCEDCDTWTVPTGGGTFVLRGEGGSGPPLAGIQFPGGWSPIPRDLLIACNDGDFCVAGDCDGPLADGPFPPGQGPLDSEQDPTVAAEWPLFCEFKLDPPLGDDPQEFFGITDGGESPTDPNSPDVVLADLGICQVDDASDPAQDILHAFGLTHDELEMGRRENGTFDRTGNTDDPTFNRLPTPPAFLAGCLGVSAPVVDAGPMLGLPPVLGHLADALGGVIAPRPLMASRVVVRDGGIGSTLGSIKSIYGAVQVLDVIQSAFGNAYIDGTNDHGESDDWDDVATTIDLTPAGDGLDGVTLYIMNDGSQLFLALGVPSGRFSAGDVVDIRFDNDVNGSADAGDDEIDITFFSPDNEFLLLSYDDEHFDGSEWGNSDEIQDGQAAFTSTFLEIEKPLFADDSDDINAFPGDVLGICVRYLDDQGEAIVIADFPVGCGDDVGHFLQVQLATG